MSKWRILILAALMAIMIVGPAPGRTVEEECGLAILFRHSVPQWKACAFAIAADVTGGFWEDTLF